MPGKKFILIGATYHTTDPAHPQVRVICERARAVDTNGNECGPCVGYAVQVIDGKYHEPMFIDKDGCFLDEPEYKLDRCMEEIERPARYWVRKK